MLDNTISWKYRVKINSFVYRGLKQEQKEKHHWPGNWNITFSPYDWFFAVMIWAPCRGTVCANRAYGDVEKSRQLQILPVESRNQTHFLELILFIWYTECLDDCFRATVSGAWMRIFDASGGTSYCHTLALSGQSAWPICQDLWVDSAFVFWVSL